MTFREAVAAGPEPLRDAFQPGKLAMKGEHRGKVECADTRRWRGSTDLDAAYARLQPTSHRWDYGLGFRERNGVEVAVWIEVHPATTGEVEVILRKYEWLCGWLKTEARELAALSRRASGERSFFWLATESGTHIRPGSLHARRLQAAGFDLPRQKIVLT